jgi:hypothetical protein
MLAAGVEVTAAFSMELQHGDDSLEAGVAQRDPAGNPVWLNTPALQTNFSPASLAFWRDGYLGMADLLAEAGQVPYLQFGEVQWWYFADGGRVGMPFYDEYSKSRFRDLHGREMQTISAHTVSPAPYQDELKLLSELIGEFTAEVMSHVRSRHPSARFEVLYPPDVNDTPLNTIVNLPLAQWTPHVLDCFKTESFTYTYQRDLNASRRSMLTGRALGFAAEKCSHLVGISDPLASWTKEAAMAAGEGNESVVLFALDQFCLIGYPAPVQLSSGRSVRMG